MAEDPQEMGQDEIEELLRQAQGSDSAAGDSSEAESEEENSSLGQNEIEALLSQGQDEQPQPPQPAAAVAEAPQGPPSDDISGVGHADVEFLLNQAEQALASVDQPESGAAAGVTAYELREFAGAPASSEVVTLDLMRDIQLDVKIELGRTHMHLEDVLQLKKGAVVALDKLAGDPVDIFVNGRLIARGEVLVLNDNFCVRVAELVVGESACA